MRELFEILFITFVNATSLLLGGVGGAFVASANAANVYFKRLCDRHDAKYAKRVELAKVEREVDEPETVDDLFDADKGFN